MSPPLQLEESARAYRRNGWMPLPVPVGQKGPVLPGWQHLRLEEADLPKHFNGVGNVGLLLGDPSGGLTDIDLDCPEALELADEFLPATPAETGRPSTPRSHRWYICPGARTRQFSDPRTKEKTVELRSTGAQTLVGPSIHPSGEPYDMLTGEPARVDADHLLSCVAALHEAVVRRRYGDLPEPSQAKPPKAKARPRSHRGNAIERRAAAYLDAMPEAVSGQGGHNATYRAAVVLVHGFELDTAAALRLLIDRYNPRCQPPWTDKELQHKVDDAASKPHDLPRGWLLAEDRKEGEGAVRLGERDPVSGRLVLSPRRTLPTADAYIRAFHELPDGRTLHAYAGMPLEWRGNRYAQVEDEWIKHRLQPWLHAALRYVFNKRTGEMELVDFESNPTTVKQALESIRWQAYLPATTVSPSWLDARSDRPPAVEILPCKSLNLHIPTGRVLPATPALFTTNALDFDYDSNPEAPERWIKFLEQLWGEDLESVDLLQEWFGYCLTADTSQQKMLLMFGPRRSGKGTIGRILTRLVGVANMVGPTTSSLAGPFGLQPLIGKSLAVVSDARFTGENVSSVVERLLCISGEDAVTIERKYLGAVTMKLPTRFMFLTNELPRLTDASTALAGRFLMLRLTRSFYSKEDVTLTDQLLGELPGILLWAIEGWKRLKQRAHFVQPASVEDAIRELEDLASPVGAFVHECCTIAAGHRAYMHDLYQAWQAWCERDGRQIISSKMSFGRDLAAAVPGIKRRRGSDMVPFYEGIGLGASQPGPSKPRYCC